MSKKPLFAWEDEKGQALECTEKVQVLNENQEELSALLKDVYEEGLALGVSKESMKKSLLDAVERLKR